MPENKTPAPEVKPEPALSQDALVAAKEKAIKDELDKLPKVEDLEKQIKELEAKKLELGKLQDLKLNFGDGKPGKKKFNLPKMPAALGAISVNGKVMEGFMELNFSEWVAYSHAYNHRIEVEQKMRYGEGLVGLTQLQQLVGGAVQMQATGTTAKF